MTGGWLNLMILGSPLPQLSDYGAVVDGVIKSVPKVYPFVKVDNYVIMPNHIHLLLSFLKDDGRGDPSPTVVDSGGETPPLRFLFNKPAE